MKNRRSPSLAATPVLSPGIARAAVWVGLGAVARSRGIGWRPGITGVEKPYFKSNQTNDPNDDNDVDSFCIRYYVYGLSKVYYSNRMGWRLVGLVVDRINKILRLAD